jgi:hypothetical protein
MAVQHGMWKIGETPQALREIKLETEALLEEQIVKDISILNSNWLLIGQQVHTDYGKFIDLLALDASGSVIIIELKKARTPRDVVAQVIDYASWIEDLPSERLSQIYSDFAKKQPLKHATLDDAFRNKFQMELTEDDLNSSHQMVIVAAELDASTERIISYLNDKASVAVNAVFFSVFEDGDSRYLSRAWMIDPLETEEHAVNTSAKGHWNGEFYCSFGVGPGSRNWEDAIEYGFISGGGGRWYSKTLLGVSPGDRLWVNIPGTGYVGVAEVAASAVMADEFITGDMTLRGSYSLAKDVGEDNAEFFVGVRWLHTEPQSKAFSEVGLFGNQNTIARPRDKKWDHTVERLKQVWLVS